MKQDTPLHRAELVQDLFESMSAMKRSIACRWQQADQEYPVSRGQIDLLFMIQHTQPVSFKQLAAQLYVTPGAVSQLVEGLEQYKLIKRQSDPKDRRIQCLEISPEGKQLIERIENQRQRIMESVMAGLTDHELAVWLRIQKKLLEQLQIERTK
jgi:MarR family multiple antibiotic resistance transcriptional regulator